MTFLEKIQSDHIKNVNGQKLPASQSLSGEVESIIKSFEYLTPARD